MPNPIPAAPRLQAGHPDATGLVLFTFVPAGGATRPADVSTYQHAAAPSTGGAGNAVAPRTMASPAGTAAVFDGSTAATSFYGYAWPGGAEYQLATYTWACRVRRDTLAVDHAVTQPVQCASGRGFLFSWEHNNAAYRLAASHDAAGAFPVVKLQSALAMATWYDIAATYDGTTLKICCWGAGTLNGLENSTAAAAPSPLGDTPFMAAGSGSNQFGGAIEYLAVWNYARAAAALASFVADPYAAARPPTGNPLLLTLGA